VKEKQFRWTHSLCMEKEKNRAGPLGGRNGKGGLMKRFRPEKKHRQAERLLEGECSGFLSCTVSREEKDQRGKGLKKERQGSLHIRDNGGHRGVESLFMSNSLRKRRGESRITVVKGSPNLGLRTRKKSGRPSGSFSGGAGCRCENLVGKKSNGGSGKG